jgi:hypothetical protein
MPKPKLHTRIIQHPFAPFLQGAILDSYIEKPDCITLDYRAFETSTLELDEQHGTIIESVRGNFFPARLRFSGVTELKGNSFFHALSSLPENSPVRTVSTLLSWRQPERNDTFYLLFMRTPEVDDPQFFARRVTFERLSGEPLPVAFVRDYSPAPPMPDRLVPRPRSIHQRFGGDPVTFHLGGKPLHHRLFIGGTDIQPERRPDVGAVLNLGEEPSRWVNATFRDQWVNKGEGSQGMSVAEIRHEAEWVIERLRLGQRVLVHCLAGMNRSVTICCAALILLEGLTAEEALARVREHHPWARPDSHHWLALKWLAARNAPPS